MDYRIGDKTALVTGGASGIGAETAQALLNEGATVILVDIDGGEVSKKAKSLGDRCHGLQADLRDADQIRGLAQTVEERFTMPDILVCAAGVTGAKGHPFNLSDADWNEAWETDFLSVLRTMRAFMPAMERRGWGRVVAVTSENAAQPYPDEAPYNVAKAAIINLVKGLSQIYAQSDVLVNTVAPAFIATPMTDQMMDKRAESNGTDRGSAIESFLEEQRPFLTMKRRGEVEEVAAVIAFLCSAQASFVAGANYRVDGGSVGAISL